MFYTSALDYIYSGNPVTNPTIFNYYLPMEVDTEYTHPKYNLNSPHKNICTNLTVQVRSIAHSEGLIYRHSDNDLDERHPTFKQPCAVFDYLEAKGVNCKLTRLPSWQQTTDIPWLQLDLYTYFAVAELVRIFQGEMREDILFLCNSPKNYGIEQTRRLRTFTRIGGQLFNWVQLPWLVDIDGEIFRLRLCIWDTSAIHGVASYADFCSNSGVTLKYKDNFTTIEKSRMDEMYLQRSEDFDNYALGDLYNYNALLGNAENFKHIYDTLGIEKYYNPPRFTIGSTVARIVEASIKNLFPESLDDTKVIGAFCKFATADYLKRKVSHTSCLNAKVDGGRCRNNRPIDTTASGVLIDIDIAGCYGEGLRIQLYPLGVPIVIDYPADSVRNDYQSLREFLKTYRKELVPGLWQARVSLPDDYKLQHPQDYLSSWFPPNDLSRMPTDEDFEATDQWWTVDNVGIIKILTHEINHAIITHDFVQWLENVASQEQQKELLDNLFIETAMFYPASERVNSIDELIDNHQKHEGKNTTKARIRKKASSKVSVERECHSWYGINLGDLLITKLIQERRKYKKDTPFNILYKLCVNTVYGDMVSPFFKIGNVVVGNNITARARALAWCLEKGFHGWQTITDGCVFDINNILHPTRRRITGESVVDLYRQTRCDHHTFAPLTDYELSVTPNYNEFSIVMFDGKAGLSRVVEGEELVLPPKASEEWINRVAMTHLRKLFTGLDILHQPTTDSDGKQRIGQFSFEAKGIFDSGCFHGTANYILAINGENKTAMRSYSKRGNKLIELKEDLEVIEYYNQVGETFLLSLQSPKKINRSHVYIKERILKVGDYSRNYRSYKDSLLYPGITVETPCLLKELSLSQFTFQSYAQMKSWYRERESYVRKYGQSYEMFFVNDDGSLNYQDMIDAVDKQIRSGAMNFFDGVDKRKQHLYRRFTPHSQQSCLQLCQQQIIERYYDNKVTGIEHLEQLEELEYYDFE